MALSPPSVIGAAIAAAVKSVGISAGTPVTDAQLTALWTAIYQVIYDDLTSNATVAPGTFNTAANGGPVRGVGGPLS